jgi:hypothetical protein
MCTLPFCVRNFQLSTESDSRRIVCGLAASNWLVKAIGNRSPQLPSPHAAHFASRHVTSGRQDPYRPAASI